MNQEKDPLKRKYKVGDRVIVTDHHNLNGQTGTIISFHRDIAASCLVKIDNPPIAIKDLLHNGYGHVIPKLSEEEFELRDKRFIRDTEIELLPFELPDLWHVVVTEENQDEVSAWRYLESKTDSKLRVGYIAGACRKDNPNYKGHNTADSIKGMGFDFGIEITTEQFRTHVLSKVPFVLPEKWCIDLYSNDPELLAYVNKNGKRPPYDKQNEKGTYAYFPSYDGYSTTARNIKKGYTEITLEQFKKHVLKSETMGKTIKSVIINQALPDVQKGTKGIPVGQGTWQFQAINSDWDTRRYSEKTILANPTTFEVVYEHDFKVNAWYTCIGPKGSKDNVGYGWKEDLTFKCTKIDEQGSDVIVFGAEGGNGVYSPFLRRATLEEIERMTTIKIGNYHSTKEGDRIAFGCQKFTKTELLTIKRLFHSEVNASINIKGIAITPEVMDKLIKQLDNK